MSLNQEQINQYRLDIAKNRTQKVLEDLIDVHNVLNTSVILLARRWKQLDRIKTKGTINYEDSTIEETKISDILLKLLDSYDVNKGEFTTENTNTELLQVAQSPTGLFSIFMISMSTLSYLLFNDAGEALKAGMYVFMFIGFSILSFTLIKINKK